MNILIPALTAASAAALGFVMIKHGPLTDAPGHQTLAISANGAGTGAAHRAKADVPADDDLFEADAILGKLNHTFEPIPLERSAFGVSTMQSVVIDSVTVDDVAIAQARWEERLTEARARNEQFESVEDVEQNWNPVIRKARRPAGVDGRDYGIYRFPRALDGMSEARRELFDNSKLHRYGQYRRSPFRGDRYGAGSYRGGRSNNGRSSGRTR